MLLVELVIVGVLNCFEGAAMIGKLKESVTLGLAIFG
jgi:hypothetical protein